MADEGSAFEEQQLVPRLECLASATRLRILRKLRSPSALRDLEVRKPREDGPAKPLARQTVQQHLDRLVDQELVQRRSADRSYGETVEYVVDHQLLYALSEELRAMARRPPEAEPERATEPAPAEPPGEEAAGPSLLLVRGADVGRRYPLEAAGAEAEWILGRRRDADVSLDHDPYVSAENARLLKRGSTYLVEDMPESRNGTQVNFEELEPGEPVELAPGDLVGAGRSILSFRS